MSENFLSRWSKRKLEVRAQEKLEEQKQLTPESVQAQPVNRELAAAPKDSVDNSAPHQAATQPELPLPTEADLVAVKQGGDIKAFMVDKVSTELKNKAFKALFSRPEFNVMDGLDIYIDDYNKFTPLSQEDIGKMTLSKQLLSRPDLDIPKQTDLESGLEKFDSAFESSAHSDSVVLDKTEGIEQQVLDESDVHSEHRVIPDESQAIDIEVKAENRSFETPEKK